jgi:hypothetical protein
MPRSDEPDMVVATMSTTHGLARMNVVRLSEHGAESLGGQGLACASERREVAA